MTDEKGHLPRGAKPVARVQMTQNFLPFGFATAAYGVRQ